MIISIVTLGSAVAAMTLRNLVHCVLALTLTFAGLAAFYLQLSAQFAGFAQLLVYVGAVSILIVVAILLTRSGDPVVKPKFTLDTGIGIATAAVVFGFIVWGLSGSKLLSGRQPLAIELTARQIGDQLMTKYVLPLEVIGILLTAALVGAVVIAMHEPKE